MKRKRSVEVDQPSTLDPCPEPARPRPLRRAYRYGITASPDDWFPGRFVLTFRKTSTERLRVGDLSLEELWELHRELGYLLAVLAATAKGESDA